MATDNLKCVDARHLVHLAVGDDALPEEERQLTDHLHACSDCRAYHAGMVDAMHVLERVRDDQPDELNASLWPGLARQQASRRAIEAIPERRRFNVAVAALCACSLVLALVTAVQNLPTQRAESFADQSLIPSTNVVFRNGGQSSQNMPTGQLVPVRQPNGAVVLVDSASGQVYIPNMIPASDDDRNLQF